MELELPAGGLNGIHNDNGEQSGDRYGGNDGNGLDPVLLDLV